MAFFSFLLLVLLIGGVVCAGVFGASYAANRNAIDRDSASNNRAELKSARSEAAIATKALRSIANGAGNPILEASDALDRINNNDMKELN